LSGEISLSYETASIGETFLTCETSLIDIGVPNGSDGHACHGGPSCPCGPSCDECSADGVLSSYRSNASSWSLASSWQQSTSDGLCGHASHGGRDETSGCGESFDECSSLIGEPSGSGGASASSG